MKKQKKAAKNSRGQADMKTAEEIYQAQNHRFHKAFNALRHPYARHKSDWCVFFSQVVGREIMGLSDMTLGERDKVIKDMQQKYSMLRIFNPAVPQSLRGWKKGDPVAGYTPRKEGDPQLRMILALWAELGQEPGTVNGVVKTRYGVDDLRFMDAKMRRGFINYLKGRLKVAGRPAKYYG